MVMDRGTVERAQSLELVPKARKGPVLKLEPDDVTGQSHESTQKKEAIAKTRQQPSHPLHCQKTLTQEREMTFDSLCFQALAWTADGELDPLDKLVLLNNLIRQATPGEQIELIQVVEKLALLQPEAAVQVSHL